MPYQKCPESRVFIPERAEFLPYQGPSLPQHSPENYFGEYFYNNNNNTTSTLGAAQNTSTDGGESLRRKAPVSALLNSTPSQLESEWGYKIFNFVSLRHSSCRLLDTCAYTTYKYTYVYITLWLVAAATAKASRTFPKVYCQNFPNQI